MILPSHGALRPGGEEDAVMTTTISMAAKAESSRAGRLELPRDGTLRLRAGAGGVRIRAERGTVLVTREGDAEDHLLERGDELLVTGSGLVVAWALAPSALWLSRQVSGAPTARSDARAA
jgi:hypothetical protein